MNYSELASVAKKPNLKPFDTVTIPGPWSLNGYVVIPDEYPLDYFDEFYEKVDTCPVGGLTFSGYLTEINNELSLLRLEQWPLFDVHKLTDDEKQLLDVVRASSVRIVGFDNNHIHDNALEAQEGAEYLSEQLKKVGGK